MATSATYRVSTAFKSVMKTIQSLTVVFKSDPIRVGRLFREDDGIEGCFIFHRRPDQVSALNLSQGQKFTARLAVM
jgi:hypothetical protein